MIDMYLVAKDFAAPIATIAAATAAAFVTVTIQQQNYRVARDRLKLDLFDKRYEIYTATRDLLLLLVRNPDLNEPAVDTELKRIYAKMAEAPFSCGARAQAFCLEVRAADQIWRTAKAGAAFVDSYPPGRERVAAVLAPSKATGRILALQDRVVPAFSDDLWIGWPEVRTRRR